MIAHHFAGNPLNRSILPKDDDSFVAILKNAHTKVLLVVTEKNAKRIVCANTTSSAGNQISLGYFTVADLMRVRDVTSVEDLIASTLLIALGQRKEGDADHQEGSAEEGKTATKPGWIIAADLPEGVEKVLPLLPPLPDIVPAQEASRACISWSYSAETGRTLLVARLQPLGELAIAGQALAMTAWHNSNLYDGKLGLPTYSIECGMKRRCSPTSSKVYPRIDPAAISLVISPDQQKFLLGRMRSMPPNFYSCLSGYIEPCESVAEAVTREVLEESGVFVDRVELIDSQPWPIGRGGSCELMLGCIAYARTWEIVITEEEVADVKWFSLEDARRLVAESLSQEGLPLDARSQQNKVFIPGPYALAHHLIKKFIELHEAGLLETNAGEFSDEDAQGSSPVDDEHSAASHKRAYSSLYSSPAPSRSKAGSLFSPAVKTSAVASSQEPTNPVENSKASGNVEEQSSKSTGHGGASSRASLHSKPVKVKSDASTPSRSGSGEERERPPASREVGYWKAVAAVSAIVSLVSFSLHLASKVK
jgi:NAD+ diphosphatase